MLFKLRVRKFAGACDELIEAKDLEQAALIGQAWCDAKAFKYIGVSSAIVADAKILEPAEAAKAARPARLGA